MVIVASAIVLARCEKGVTSQRLEEIFTEVLLQNGTVCATHELKSKAQHPRTSTSMSKTMLQSALYKPPSIVVYDAYLSMSVFVICAVQERSGATHAGVSIQGLTSILEQPQLIARRL